MPPMPDRIGRLFRRKQEDSQTPPKALYDDLESAHESITRKTSSGRSEKRTRSHQSNEHGGLSTLVPAHLPSRDHIPKERVRSIALALTSASSPALMREETLDIVGRPDMRSAIHRGHRHGHSLASPTEATGINRRSSGIDDTSQWQTVISETDFEDEHDTDRVPGPARNVAQKSFAYHDSPNHKLSSVQGIIGSDTVDNIIHSYLPDAASGGSCSSNIKNDSSTEIVSRDARSRSETAGLHQFAWSPCTSDVDPLEILYEADIGQDRSEHIRRGSVDYNVPEKAHAHQLTSRSLHSPSWTSEDGLWNIKRRTFVRSSTESSQLAGDLSFVKRHDLDDHQLGPFHKPNGISGIVSEGRLSRAMSQAELEDSLSYLVRSALRNSNFTETSNRFSSISGTNEQHDVLRNATIEALGQRAGDHAGDFETTTTLSSFYQRNRTDASVPEFSSPQMTIMSPAHRKTTSGLLGRLGLRAFKKQPAPELTRKDSRLAQAAAAAGVKENGRLGRALTGSPHQSQKVNEDGSPGIPASARPSLVPYDDFPNSVNGVLEDSSKTYKIQGDVSERNATIYPVQHRHNHSWSLVKDQVTGSLTLIPDRISRGLGRIPYRDAEHVHHHVDSIETPSSDSQPDPSSENGQHPIAASSYVSPTTMQNRQQALDQPLRTQEKRVQRDIMRFYVSQSSSKDAESDVKKGESDSSASDFNADKAWTGSVDPPLSRTMYRQASSTWLSTVSEGQSNVPWTQSRISSFTKTAVIGHEGNLTGTPDGTGARETGSSLAESSTPGEGYAETAQVSPTLPKKWNNNYKSAVDTSGEEIDIALSAFHQHVGAMRSPCLPSKMDKITRLHSPSSYTQDSSNIFSWKRSPARILFAKDKHSDRSNVPSTSPLKHAPFGRHRSRSLAKLQSHRIEHANIGAEDKTNWKDSLPPQAPLRYTVNFSNSGKSDQPDKACQSLRNSVNDVFSGRRMEGINTQKQVHLLSPEHKTRKFEGLSISPPRPQTASPLIRHAISLDSPPRLYDNICLPDAIMEARHKRYSRLWALICMFIPFLGLLFGHGYLDKIMLWHSAGGITGFRRQEKHFVLIYSYSTFATVLVALAITMVVVSK